MSAVIGVSPDHLIPHIERYPNGGRRLPVSYRSERSLGTAAIVLAAALAGFIVRGAIIQGDSSSPPPSTDTPITSETDEPAQTTTTTTTLPSTTTIALPPSTAYGDDLVCSGDPVAISSALDSDPRFAIPAERQGGNHSLFLGITVDPDIELITLGDSNGNGRDDSEDAIRSLGVDEALSIATFSVSLGQNNMPANVDNMPGDWLMRPNCTNPNTGEQVTRAAA